MHFLSNGDFGFPFESSFYWIKSFFIWSFQNGAANPDGIIRIPSILLNALTFEVFGNLAAAYFYIFLVFAVCFASFYVFARSFLNIESKLVASMGALFFTFNPIFLGNVSKVGLTLAVAMLPFCLVLIKKAFATGNIRYLIGCLFLVNISLVHPFTCVVNVLIAGGYLVYNLWITRKAPLFSWKKLAIIPLLAIVLNAYFILPIINLGTVSKDVISQDVNAAPTSYTDLVDVANTGDMLTSLSLTKNVLKDYDFYSMSYETVYFIAIFTFFIVMFGVYVFSRNKWQVRDNRRFIIMVGGFLGLVLLATGTFLNIDRIIKFIIGFPGGWMFRSPLKWQLYIPFFLFAAFVIVLKNVPRTRQKAIYGTFAVLFILINAYVFQDVYRKILTPRQVQNFAQLQKEDLSNKSILYINSNECNDFSRMYPDIQTELRQVVKSQNVQFKTTTIDTLPLTSMKDFDYVLGCDSDLERPLKDQAFKQTETIAGEIAIYKNQKPTNYIFATDTLYQVPKPQDVNAAQSFTGTHLNENFNYVLQDAKVPGARDFSQLFGALTRDALTASGLKTESTRSDVQQLYMLKPQNTSYLLGTDFMGISGQADTFGTTVPEGETKHIVAVPNQVTSFGYQDKNFDYKNLIANPSLEDGQWKKEVGDCSAYDSRPRIAMSLNTEDKTDGKQSLQLESSAHIACTAPKRMAVQPGARYLISFDYKNTQGKATAGYNISFDDADKTNESSRLRTKDSEWHQFDKEITVPSGAKTIGLTTYAFPDTSSSQKNIALYDNFTIVEIPDVHDNYYMVGQPTKQLAMPASISVDAQNPTQKKVQVSGAKDAFYLVMKDGYSKRWVASIDGSNTSASILSTQHFKVNGATNGWYIDVNELCKDSSCQKNNDGSYSFTVTINYTSQKWFVIGLVVSAVAWIATLAWIVYDWRKDRRRTSTKV